MGDLETGLRLPSKWQLVGLHIIYLYSAISPQLKFLFTGTCYNIAMPIYKLAKYPSVGQVSAMVLRCH